MTVPEGGGGLDGGWRFTHFTPPPNRPHQAEDGDLAVIGVFMDAGEAHAAISSSWDAIPGVEESPARRADFDPNAPLPEGCGYSRYAGSLITPPCSKVVSLGCDGRVDHGFAGADRHLHGPASDERTSCPAATPEVHSGGSDGLILSGGSFCITP